MAQQPPQYQHQQLNQQQQYGAAIPSLQSYAQQLQPHQMQFVPQSQPQPLAYPSLQNPLPFTIPYATQQYHANPYGSVPMAQYPIPPQTFYSQPAHHYSGRSTSKRAREAVSEAGEAQPTKRQAVGNDVLFRFVVPSAQIGKVIGRGGHRVQMVREDTKATIKIADAITHYEERVIIISSKENEGGITDAEKALLQIAALILADDGSSFKTPSVSAATNPYGATRAVGTAGTSHEPSNSVKLLIAGSQAGSLIDVSGQNIEKLRNSSGAMITVLSPNQLPLCASVLESDRLVQISGDVTAVLKALEEIGIELRANPPKEVISISPAYNLSIARSAQAYMDPNAAEYVTLDMIISETMVGGFIGKQGSNISRIRSESGAMIKIFGGKGEQKHRQIQLIGTAQQYLRTGEYEVPEIQIMHRMFIYGGAEEYE